MDPNRIDELIEQTGGHFSYGELAGFVTTGPPEKLKEAFLLSFLLWRKWHNIPTMVTSAVREDDDGAHGEGVAIDCILWTKWKDTLATALHQWLLATTWPFQGVGIYFDWTYAGKPVIGLHVDGLQEGTRPLRWLRITREVVVKGKPTMKKLYYYQSTETGKFYNSYLKETISLEFAIKKYARSNQ